MDHVNKVKMFAISSRVWRHSCGRNTSAWPCLRVCQPCMNIWFSLWRQCRKKIDDWLCQNSFDSWHFKTEGESLVQSGRCGDGVAPKQSGQSTFMTRHKDAFLLWQIGAYCTILLQDKKWRDGKCEKHEWRRRIQIAMQHNMHLRSVRKWIMDSSATKHITWNRATFDTYEVIFPCNVHIDNIHVAKAIGMGSIDVGIQRTCQIIRISNMNMLHVAQLQINLVLVSKLLSNGFKVHFHVDECIVGGTDIEVVAITQRTIHEGMQPISCVHMWKVVR